MQVIKSCFAYFLTLATSWFCALPVFSQESIDRSLTLWYDQPARIWEEALPLGNGLSGAMVFGGIQEEHFQLNDHTLWSGGPEPGNNLQAAALLPELRSAIFSRNYEEAEAIWRNMQGPYSARYLPLGDLRLLFDMGGTTEEYVRTLDINEAVATVDFLNKGTRYQRTAFISHPAKTLVIQLKADKKGKLSFGIQLDSKLRHSTKATSRGMIMQGQAPYEVAARNYFPDQVVYNNRGIRFEAHLGIDLKGGEIVVQDSTLKIQNADEVTLYLTESTNFAGFDQESGHGAVDPGSIARGYLKAAMNKGGEKLRKEHVLDYKNLFERVKFDLVAPTDYSQLPTDQRLKLFMQHGDDVGLQKLYYQFGRYLLISSSRPGSRPANLQGLWNDKIHPPWGSNYTININTEMNYWLAESTNLPECHEALFSFIEELAVNGAKTAKVNYGIDEGWMAHHNSDLWAKTSPVGHFDMDKTYYPQAFCWQMGGAWLSTHLWEHYRYNRDKVFLSNRAYPLMKGAAQFLQHWLVADPESGYLLTVPSSSPENHFTYEGKKYAIGKGTAMDLAIVRKLFTDVIEAAKELGEDEAFRKELEEQLARVYPHQIGRYGQIQEWYDDVDDPKDTHRHISQLFGLYPGTEIDPLTTPALADAARVTLEHRGDVSTGWSMAWKVNWWARLRDGDRSYKILQKAFNYINPADKTVKSTSGGGTYPNLFDAHPPFQIDGNFGATAGMTEMIMQSHTDIIDLLPALPRTWKEGKVLGIKARGNFQVDLHWKDMEITYARLKSLSGGECIIRSKRELKSATPARSFERDGFFYLSFDTEKDEIIDLF
ncbi:glycoside hydrolase family 95 protein [Sphingobacterium yanglingense]|uniref:Alpha-L-fucosidase 2 n=1 Tax=Sphingobacterium yanglingense TaxID=1437280 RepID=A0A4R6WEN2_9SPHI|nr:glycoside hydrolase family 95 protein [Sphingobacterium yanglingense]TDQ76483.1 alpha-L-fucosidase 2 [Sphingobacterium yanglingense]